MDLIYGLVQQGVNVVNFTAQKVGLQQKSPDNQIDVRQLEREIVDKVGMGSTGPARFLIRVAGLSGAAAVSMAAYGEHRLKASNEDEQKLKKVFDVGNKMHLFHSVVLLATPMSRTPILTGVLMTSGILLFSGSCYAHALTGNREIRYVTPYGGIALILAWLTFLF